MVKLYAKSRSYLLNKIKSNLLKHKFIFEVYTAINSAPVFNIFNERKLFFLSLAYLILFLILIRRIPKCKLK